jgi:hypothetical protein
MSFPSQARSTKFVQLNPADENLLRAAFRYYYLSSRQACRLFYSFGSLTYVQTKLKSLTDAGFLQRIWLPRPSPHGSAPSVYTLARRGLNHLRGQGLDVSRRYRPSEQNERSYLFLAHTLAVNDVLIGAELLSRYTQSVQLARVLHERDLKRSPLRVEDNDGRYITVVPDGWLDFRVNGSYQACLAVELDRGTEEQKAWRRKVRGLLAFANGPYQEVFQTRSLTIAVVATSGDQRLLQLIRWTENELALLKEESQGDLFVFTGIAPQSAPTDLFTATRWFQPFGEKPVALLEPS